VCACVRACVRACKTVLIALLRRRKVGKTIAPAVGTWPSDPCSKICQSRIRLTDDLTKPTSQSLCSQYFLPPCYERVFNGQRAKNVWPGCGVRWSFINSKRERSAISPNALGSIRRSPAPVARPHSASIHLRSIKLLHSSVHRAMVCLCLHRYCVHSMPAFTRRSACCFRRGT